jgi:hypothetical protein
MALFMDRSGRERNPLGGYAADGFDQWLRVTEQTVREAAKPGGPLSALATDHAGRYLATSAARHYGDVLKEWTDVKAGRSAHVRDELARDHFEVGLIAKVMSAYGAAQYARECGYDRDGVTAGGRPMVDVTGEYLRACIILGKYLGVSEVTVAACTDDQDAFLALRNTRKG